MCSLKCGIIYSRQKCLNFCIYALFIGKSSNKRNWTDKTKLSDDRLKRLVEHMHSLKVGNLNYSADVMGDAYEFLIKDSE